MMDVLAMTDIGLVRRENQDSYAICQDCPSGHTVCVVCDGMGGSAGGKLASSIASNVYLEQLRATLREGMSQEEVKEASAQALSQANKAIGDEAVAKEAYHNMGTTLVSAIADDHQAVITNVGDSRAYHICESGIRRISKDHSLVERMVDQGEITAEEARRHPSRNLITRALGLDTDAQCDQFDLPIAPGEYILLCTDGLSGTVTDQEMLFEIIHNGEMDTCLDRLLEISKGQGAPDNVTAVLMRKR